MAKHACIAEVFFFSGLASNCLGKKDAAVRTLQQSRRAAENVSVVTRVCFNTAGV